MSDEFPIPDAPKNPFKIREDFVDGFGVSKDFYFCIGLMAAEWSRVEELFGILIFLRLGISPSVGWFLMANMGFRSRVNTLRTFIDVTRNTSLWDKHHEHLTDLQKLTTEIEEVYTLRNTFVHTFYSGAYGSETAKMLSIRARGKLRITSKTVHHTELDDVYRRAFHLRQRLAEMVRELDEEGFFHDIEPQQEDGTPGHEVTPSLDPTRPVQEPPPRSSQG